MARTALADYPRSGNLLAHTRTEDLRANIKLLEAHYRRQITAAEETSSRLAVLERELARRGED